MTLRTFTRSFAAGEVSPLLAARLDLDRFQVGVAMALNMETLAQGPAQNRAGYQYVLEAKDSAKPVWLLPFSYSTQQTFALEFGDQYIRFHTNGGTLLNAPRTITTISDNASQALFSTFGPHGYATGEWVQLSGISAKPELNGRWGKVQLSGFVDAFLLEDFWGQPIGTIGMPAGGTGQVASVYEIESPYAAEDLKDLHYVQSADVLTLVHEKYEPRELRRLGATNWSLDVINFASTLAPPKSTGAAPSPITHTYIVSGVAPSNGGYTGFSSPVTASNDLTVPGRYNLINWSSVPGGIMYFVYKRDPVSGAYGLLGAAASGAVFIDDGTKQPDMSAPQYVGLGAAPVASATALAPASTNVVAVPTGSGAKAYTYVVTSASEDGTEESMPSAEVTANNDLSIAGNFNTVGWPLVPGVVKYFVYRKVNGIFGRVGSAGSECTFVDANIGPDLSLSPPIQLNPFLGSGNYPRAVSYFEQRRVFGGTLNQPQNVWMTRSGTEKSLAYSSPSRDDDAVALRVVSREANTIRHMIPMDNLILLTSGGEWKLGAADGGALAPSNASVRPQGYSGSSNVQPVVTDRTILFAQDRGGAVREIEFSWQQQGYQTSDVSILAPHLFEYRTVIQMAFSRSPLPSLWTVRSDGALLGMTYVPQHEVKAWHQHTTDGSFESICCVAEQDEDVIYAVIRREVNGRAVRYIERKHTRRFDTPADQFFVDSGLTYTGAPATVIGGLWHLEGKTVSLLADGGVSPAQVVVNGKVTLDAPASKVQAGLPYVARLQSLPLSLQIPAGGQGIQKNVNRVTARVLSSGGFEAGPTFAKLRATPTRQAEPYGSPPDLITGETPLVCEPMWGADGSICFQQAQPLSFTLLGYTLEVATGG